MLSMTGYGRGDFSEGGLSVSVEIKTVNNRYLDVSFKCPRSFSPVEDEARARIRDRFSRGHADVYVTYSDKRRRAYSLSVDEAAAAAYVEAAGRLAHEYPVLSGDFSVRDLMGCPDVLTRDDAPSLDGDAEAAFFSALDSALLALDEMREREGEKLKSDMLARVGVCEGYVRDIAARAPFVAADYAEKIRARVEEYLSGTGMDEGRILTEVAVFTDKCNIDEEITRLLSHAEQFRSICGEPRSGKKLDFLVQEFNREANTVCSKSNDLEVTRLGLALKNEIEKIREQVQNVE